VHELFTPSDVRQLRENHPGVTILAHPECPPEVVAEADFSGSTAAMSDFVSKRRPPRVVLLTECSMSDNVAVLHPDVEFIRPCNLCPHMKRITLPKILDSLVYLKEEVVIDPAIAAKARRSVEAMVNLNGSATRIGCSPLPLLRLPRAGKDLTESVAPLHRNLVVSFRSNPTGGASS
jgi:quinolinate synthase